MTPAERYAQNLAALAVRQDGASRSLVVALGNRGPGALAVASRDGSRVPAWACQGRPRALVSTYGAETEARRWAEGWAGGTAVVWGGAGTAAAGALDARGLRLAFWVEPRAEVWQSLFTWEDWTPWLARDEWVPVCLDARSWGSLLRDRYHPLWDGALRTFEWRAAEEPSGDLWAPYRDEARAALDDVAADASTQARFGERWYRNTLVNLKNLEVRAVEGCPGKRVIVAGAGPTLGDHLNSASNQGWLDARGRTGDRLYAVDTAFPALVARGVVPDLVFSLDGQLPTYHHFVAPDLPPVPLVADLAALPLLGRRGLPVVRYLSGHPLGAVIRRFFPELPTLDGSLGNVSGLARQTAWALGAREVATWGVDFGYRDGQAYTQGAYVYDLGARGAHRLAPLETRLSLAAYAARGRERRPDPRPGAWDTTPLLRDYRRRWDEPRRPAPPVTLAHGSAEGRWGPFADHWRRRLQRLVVPTVRSFHSWVRGLDEPTRQDWLALWPLALALHRAGVPVEDVAEVTRTRALGFLED